MNIILREGGCPPEHTTLEELISRFPDVESWYDVQDIVKMRAMNVGEIVRFGDTGCTDLSVERLCNCPRIGNLIQHGRYCRCALV